MAKKSWLPVDPTSHFSLDNIPFGIITTPISSTPHPAIAIGHLALDLHAFATSNGFSALPQIHPHLSTFSSQTLNAFAALGRPIHRQVRSYLQDILSETTSYPNILKENPALQEQCLFSLAKIHTHLPFQIGDYTDFFVGRNHARNAGSLFRSSAQALNANYSHLPVAYHSRASSVVISGTPIRRPWGQMLSSPSAVPDIPIMAPTRRLDLELEIGAFVCRSNTMGDRVSIEEAEEALFGLVLLNDWSARDVQGWEYVPLGPFNAKNFGTSVSAWVVLMDALEPFRTKGLESEVELLPYLKEKKQENVYDIQLEVDITTPSKTTTTITHTSARNLLFSFPQMLAHHTIGGCPLQVGDLLGSGTISGTEPGSEGCLLEQNRNGAVVIKLKNGTERTFLEDGDEVCLRGWAGEDGGRVGFGECVGRVVEAWEEG